MRSINGDGPGRDPGDPTAVLNILGIVAGAAANLFKKFNLAGTLTSGAISLFDEIFPEKTGRERRRLRWQAPRRTTVLLDNLRSALASSTERSSRRRRPSPPPPPTRSRPGPRKGRRHVLQPAAAGARHRDRRKAPAGEPAEHAHRRERPHAVGGRTVRQGVPGHRPGSTRSRRNQRRRPGLDGALDASRLHRIHRRRPAPCRVEPLRAAALPAQ